MESNTKKWRGTSLSQKQYDIIVSCLRTGNKPSIESLKAANLYGKLNGGKLNKPCGGYFRFKSIINRLSLRKSDGALTFKGNGKIVLPNSKFASVVLAAHKSPGTRHLNISATVAKLSEKYTIGCRQFGICEETVRVAIKSCKEGSCAEKPQNRYGVSIMKNLVKNEKHQTDENQQATRLDSSKVELTSPTTKPSGIQQTLTTVTVPKQLADQDPAYAILEKLPNGNFIIKQFITRPSPLTVDNQLANAEPNQSSQASQFRPRTNNSLLPSLGNNFFVMSCPPFDQSNLVKNFPTPNQPVQNATRFAIPVNFIITNQQQLSATDRLNPSMLLLQQLSIPAVSSQLSATTTTSKDSTCNKDVEKNAEKVPDNSIDEKDMDCTNMDKFDQTSAESSKHQSEPAQTVRIKMPYPQLWHNLIDLEKEMDPFLRMNMAIKDLKLEVQKSLRGDRLAMEMLKTKIDVVSKMVRAQKERTQTRKSELP